MNQAETNPLATAILSNVSVSGDGAVEEMQFIKVSTYTTFEAEYAIDDNDIVFHFFLPPELANQSRSKNIKKYWLETFPQKLEPVVYAVFKAQFPRVQASHIEELGLDSWWLKAYGFATVLAPESLCALLFSELDKALDTSRLK